MSARKAPETINSLRMPQRLALAQWMTEHYAAGKLDDPKSAAAAAAALGFPVTVGNILGMRQGMGIAPNRPHTKQSPADAGTVLARLATLESQIADLIAKLGGM